MSASTTRSSPDDAFDRKPTAVDQWRIFSITALGKARTMGPFNQSKLSGDESRNRNQPRKNPGFVRPRNRMRTRPTPSCALPSRRTLAPRSDLNMSCSSRPMMWVFFEQIHDRRMALENLRAVLSFGGHKLSHVTFVITDFGQPLRAIGHGLTLYLRLQDAVFRSKML